MGSEVAALPGALPESALTIDVIDIAPLSSLPAVGQGYQFYGRRAWPTDFYMFAPHATRCARNFPAPSPLPFPAFPIFPILFMAVRIFLVSPSHSHHSADLGAKRAGKMF